MHTSHTSVYRPLADFDPLDSRLSETAGADADELVARLLYQLVSSTPVHPDTYVEVHQ